MKFFVLLLIYFIGLEARDTKNDHVQSRSESPPLFGDVYSIESHESYRPVEPQATMFTLQQQLQRHQEEKASTKTYNHEKFRDVLTSMSSENIEYVESDNENIYNNNQILGAVETQHGDLSMNIRNVNDRLAMNELDQQNAQTRLASLKDDTYSNIFIEDNDSTSAETTDNKCDLGARSSLISNYMKLGDKVVREEISWDEKKIKSRENIRLDVIHDVFETASNQGGLLEGIIYKVEILLSPLLDVTDLILETTEKQNLQIGEFILPEKPKDYNNKSLEIEQIEEVLWKNSGKSSDRFNVESETQSSKEFSDSLSEKSVCEKNVLYHRLNRNKKVEKDEKLFWHWTMRNMNDKLYAKSGNNSINFRLLYRRRNRREIFESNFTFVLLQECLLTLKAHNGWFDSSTIPNHAKNCTFRLSSMNQNEPNEKTAGLLIKLLRFNVPCNNGGFLQFKQSITMCGKLEELPENRRTLYFKSYANTTWSLFNYPKVYFVYKLVDHCYNITFLERNSSFVIEPTVLALKCHFKIHLPFGNQVELKLRLNGNSGNEQKFLHSEIKLREGNFNYSDLTLEDFSLTTDFSLSNESFACVGVLVEIINRSNEKWNQCIAQSEANKNIAYTLKSSDNVLFVRITKAHNREDNKVLMQDSTKVSNNNKNDENDVGPSISLEYLAVPVANIASQCAFGWILVGQFCLSTFNELMTWQSAESFCIDLGGHLASVRSESEHQLLDQMLMNSPYYNEHVPYWIGATDKQFEGEFRWSDGLPFSYSKWFPGWEHHENYNRQPNDDGLSKQDCVEIRRHFFLPEAKAPLLTDSFMWNDIGCSTKNFFICERPLIDEPSNYEVEDCNKTIYLTRDKTKTILSSPGFPRFYANNMNCMTFVVAPTGYRILIEFEELVIEHEPQCSYDYLEMFEPMMKQANKNRTSRQNRGPQKKNMENSVYEVINSFPSIHKQQQIQKLEFQQLLKDYVHQSLKPKNIFQPSNALFNLFRPPPSTSDRMPRIICGDWSSKLKLLRYQTGSNLLGVRFSSDYSHNFSGFKAKISMEKAASECIDERLKLFNDSCYLVVAFPEVEWVLAQKICHSMGAQLTSVSSLEEHRFIITTVKDNLDYNPRSFYWLGAEHTKNGLEWTDGSKISYTGWLLGEEKVPKVDPMCLGLQWKMSPTPMLPSNLYWAYQKCSNNGGYICKKNRKDNTFIQNQTITGIEGRLTSPNYPHQYAPNINYWIKIIAPERSRIVVQFQKIDLEPQQECLYDYVSVEDLNYRLSSFHQKDDNEIFHKLKTDPVEKEIQSKHQSVSVVSQTLSFKPYVRWCGSHEGDMSRFDFVSKSSEVLFHFSTDYSTSAEGFSAIWRSIDITACPGQTFTSSEGVLMSPNFPNFLLHELSCTYTIQAQSGRKLWLEFNSYDISRDAEVSIDLGNDVLIQPFRDENVLGDGVFLSSNEKVRIILRTGGNPLGKGFKVTYRSIVHVVEHRIVNLGNSTVGKLYHLNYPQAMPTFVDFNQHLTVALGHVISVQLQGVHFVESGCNSSSSLEIFDKYAEKNGIVLCRVEKQGENSQIANSKDPPVIFITSYLNTIHIRQRSLSSDKGLLNATIRVQTDDTYKLKLISTTDNWVESCQPNPCQYEGKCVVSGEKQVCQCKGHFTGRFCGLTMCEVDPCVFGQCELTNSGFKCLCQPGYLGLTCDQRQKPCNDNPCEGRGECIEQNGGYYCRCFAWFEGPKCDKRMKIPYRPLSERMFQEPFWLGLIAVFVVLAVIGLVWCAKRHFPEKIEKLLQDEAERNRPAHLRHHHHISLREQLQVAGAANNPLMQSSGSQPGLVTTPGTQKSIFGRLGIRKPSLLSLSSPQPPQGSAARTFSLDDLLRPIPRRSSSPRKKRTNSTPTRTNTAEKKHILQQLVSPPSANNKVVLGELIQLSENISNRIDSLNDSETNLGETAFIERPGSVPNTTAPLLRTLTRQISSDSKLEKKVTFARLLSKMSAEINGGSNIDGNNHLSALSLPTEVQFRTNSVPQSPCTNDIRSPHSTSSNQGSDSLSSSELALHDFSLRNNARKHRPKVSSADSILAMFRNFASSSAGVNLPASLIFSPSSSTPTASSPQDDIAGDDDSSTSSVPTPVSFSSGAPDSPIFYRQSTIEVPVFDAISAHKSTPAQNLLNPPTILLEIPGNINKCLSPIRELPTPMPSPCLTPIMPRPHRNVKSNNHDEAISVMFSDDDDKNLGHRSNKTQFLVDLTAEMNRGDSDNDSGTLYTSSDTSNSSQKRLRLASVPSISIDINPPTPEETERKVAQRPKDLIIPELIVQTPSPTRERYPVINFLGSPPPQRASIGASSGLFPNKQQQKKLLMQFEKAGSLDFPFAPPIITITANMSEAESDAEFLSPSTPKNLLIPTKNITGMTYLSPFSMCTRNERAPSEGNLSSSGYSSMASPGPSRCGSNNKLCASEMDTIISIPIPLTANARLHHSILKRPSDTIDRTTGRNKDDIGGFRKRSDSETLSDETLLESNDEGIGTDQLDEKIEEGQINSAKDLEAFIGKELFENGKSLLNNEDVVVMSQLQLPSIVINTEQGVDKLSPVSSRSESPLSDRNNGMGRFSPQFYGKKDQRLPFTDSDGLYDFPSSDGKGGSGDLGQHRKSTGKRRERRSSKSNASTSPSKNSVHLELPIRGLSSNHPQATTSKFNSSTNFARKSPKRRPHRYTPSSSSSTESLTGSNSNTREASMPSIKLRDCLIENLEMKHYDNADDEAEKFGSGSGQARKLLPVKSPPKKMSRMKAIGNQIRFLRRLEQALKERDKAQLVPEEASDDSELTDSPKASSPLLLHKQKPAQYRFLRQKRVANVNLDDKRNYNENDYLSD